jgi:hypothetical protein
MGPAWHAPFPMDWRTVDGETVAYCDVTGDTFKVAPVAHAVLLELASRPQDLESLSSQIAGTFGATGSPDVAAIVEQTVSDLETLGIIERVSL